jgi:cellulose biosynthesis protein BcsQ
MSQLKMSKRKATSSSAGATTTTSPNSTTRHKNGHFAFAAVHGVAPSGFKQVREYVVESTGEWKKDRPKVIVMHAQKGGVGKTTLSSFVAWQLAAAGKKVMVVDADPQCNLSELLLKDFSDHLIDDAFDGNNIMTFFKTGENEDGRILGNFQQLPKCLQVPNFQTTKKNGSLFILPGSPSLTTMETRLTVHCYQSNLMEESREKPGTLIYGIRATAAWHNADYVVIDTNPNGGTLNQLLVLGGDALIIPANPSSFMLQVLKRAPEELYQDWVNSYQAFTDNVRRAKAILQLPPSQTAFLGVIMNDYKIYNITQTGPFRLFRNKILEEMENEEVGFIARLESLGFEIPFERTDSILGEVENMAGHAPLAQFHHYAVQWLPDHCLGTFERGDQGERFKVAVGKRKEDMKVKRARLLATAKDCSDKIQERVA